MGDHLFEARVLRQLLLAPVEPGESLLAVDSRPTAPEIADEATKVRLRGSHIIAIGKTLTEYDALDTGLFVCAPSLFGALESARAQGDTTLSGGIRILAARGLMRSFDVGDATWCDIDTIEDLHSAESLLDSPDPGRDRGRHRCTEMTTEARHSAIRLGTLALGVALFAGALYYINVGTTLEIVRRLGMALPLALVLSGLWHLARTWAWARVLPAAAAARLLASRARAAGRRGVQLSDVPRDGRRTAQGRAPVRVDRRTTGDRGGRARTARLPGRHHDHRRRRSGRRTDRPASDAAVVPRLPRVCDWLRHCHGRCRSWWCSGGARTVQSLLRRIDHALGTSLA